MRTDAIRRGTTGSDQHHRVTNGPGPQLPDALRRKLKARAAAASQTLSDYVLAEFERLAMRRHATRCSRGSMDEGG
jgi:hypothetical protein